MSLLSLSGAADPLGDYLNRITGNEPFMLGAMKYPLSVHFIDVGCGDSIFISAEGKNILIDTGKYSLDGRTAQYLKKTGADHIDLFVATHTDSDHIGDFSSVAGAFRIDKIWLSDFCKKPEEKQSEDEKIFYTEIKNRKIKLLSPETGIYDFGSFSIEVLSPTEPSEEDNDNSLVLRLVYGDVSFLFTGDAGKKIENKLVKDSGNIRSDILKAGHHGSNGSTTAEFLKAVSPSVTVISAGEENNALPNRNCIDRIKQSGSDILRTDIDGTVIITYDGKELSCIKEKPSADE